MKDSLSLRCDVQIIINAIHEFNSKEKLIHSVQVIYLHTTHLQYSEYILLVNVIWRGASKMFTPKGEKRLGHAD